MSSPDFIPKIPSPLAETSSIALEWPRLREHIASRTFSPLGRTWVLALEPSGDLAWINSQQQRTEEMRGLFSAGVSFDFHGLFEPTDLLDKARIEGSALDPLEILSLVTVVERIVAWINLIFPSTSASQTQMQAATPGITQLSALLREQDLVPLLRQLHGKIEPDGSLSDDASPELHRIRRAIDRQHRAIEESLRRSLRRLSEDGSTRDELITIRGDRFVIPVRAEFKRKVPGVVHGSSSSGQTVFVEPLETIEQNNELVRLLDEEQSEIHRILVAMTRALSANAPAIHSGAAILAEAEAHAARARFAAELNCVRPVFSSSPEPALSLTAARHPLLELRMVAQARAEGVVASSPIPLTIALASDARQLIISGPNTGGKTVSLKTIGLVTLMAQAGVPVPALEARLPIFTGIYADIGDAQSIERNLSSFSAHVVNLDRISREATSSSLVLLDELGSATDPEEGAALAVAVAQYFLRMRAWCCITTHLTSLKVYAATNPGVLNAAVGFDQETLTPTYQLRLGVPGASAGLNIAARLGLDPAIIASARAQLSTQTADIAAFLDQLHDQLTATAAERETLKQREQEIARAKMQLDLEGRAEQRARTRELETKLSALLDSFAVQLRDSVKAIGDKAAAKRIQRDSALALARARREFSSEFQSTIATHVASTAAGASRGTSPAPAVVKTAEPGDMVKLKSLGRQGRIERVIDSKTFEVSVGPMKMRVSLDDISEIEKGRAVTPLEAARKRGGVTVSTTEDPDYISSEINVIGRTADEAQDEVARFVDRAFLAGLPRIRIVHGTGMGILRRTLREYLRSHPHVATITEPPQNQGGQGATEVELRQ
ncbi:endonuclease MutS2 [Edaphobacter modestus]|uniref:Endonuclease MutS2 n=1 Tax=Edaphobacter modestus TaxID=388466 RepID=A0A4Q7YV54_9BACT|nr:Smr/MutS family protein [Edaphobacter modestus]RZU41762.1 DNA mismatch repair protein MutS2 [Edaphobacter modestus]